MKLGYMGTPEISAELLKALLSAGHEVLYVISNPDRPKGRSGTPQPSAVSQVAMDAGLRLYRPEKPAEVLPELQSLTVDAVIVFAYGSILPEGFLSLGQLGIFNLHGSLLPELRGASPIQSAILQGMNRTGWTFQFVSLKMDCGDIVAECALPIGEEETAAELTQRMVPEGVRLVLDTLPELQALAGKAKKQDENRATYCRKIRPEDSFLDWSKTATELHNQIRGMNPRPVARTMLNDTLVKIYRSRVLEAMSLQAELASIQAEKQLMARAPGELLSIRLDGKPALCVVTGQAGLLQILSLQPQSKKQMDAASFLNGHRIRAGEQFAMPAEI
ncbi:MAG: methionyl-tRNA formyltransferase [Leptospiraceae bacterium]|nr:methionyl-tRNA formyltransferase [Leptospiraceae bacterium]